jgi:hypothetical protein
MENTKSHPAQTETFPGEAAARTFQIENIPHIFQLVEPSPPSVREEDIRTYWVRTETRNYTPMKSSELRRYARTTLAVKDVDLFLYNSGNRRARIRSIAGVEPGLYEAENQSILVPELIPLITPPALEDPPADFQRLSLMLAERLGASNQDADEIKTLQLEMVAIYERERRVQRASLRLRRRRLPFPFPWDDHRRLFKGESGLIWTSQPYGYETPEIVGFAHQYGLTVNISAAWSWHYPGKTPLIEWHIPNR